MSEPDDSSLDAFYEGRLVGPLAKLERAKAHIDNFDAARDEFIATDPYVRWTKDDPKFGDLVYYIEVKPHAAEGLRDLSLITGDAVHNLRSALDLLAWQLVEAHSGKPGDGTMFPIWHSEGQFLGGGPGRMRGAHPDAIKALRGLNPYKGGNESLWRLNRLDATDKHRLLLAVGAMHTETVLRFTLWGESRWQTIPNPGLRALEDGAEIFRIPRSAREYFEDQPDPEFSFVIALREPETPDFLDMDIALDSLWTYTGFIIELFEPFLT